MNKTLTATYALVAIACLGGFAVGHYWGIDTGEKRVRYEVNSAASVCEELRAMDLNDLAVKVYEVDKEVPFFHCKTLHDIADDKYWDDASKGIYFDNIMGFAPKHNE